VEDEDDSHNVGLIVNSSQAHKSVECNQGFVLSVGPCGGSGIVIGGIEPEADGGYPLRVALGLGQTRAMLNPTITPTLRSRRGAKGIIIDPLQPSWAVTTPRSRVGDELYSHFRAGQEQREGCHRVEVSRFSPDSSISGCMMRIAVQTDEPYGGLASSLSTLEDEFEGLPGLGSHGRER
jgi:hypothetical protein